MKTAVIFGVNGQDGSYLSELLLSKGYHVIGVSRRVSVNTSERLGEVKNHLQFTLVEGDIIDPSSVNHIIRKFEPDECYNLAAQSHVATSFEQPHFTFQVDAVGVLNILEAIRNFSSDTRFYQASTSEMFGANYLEEITWGEEYESTSPTINRYQDETTLFAPRSPYAVAKVAAHHLVYTYREAYGLHASCGILFNHESERRGENFVTRKITKYIGKLKGWMNDVPAGTRFASFPKLHLGNIEAYRDWGHAEDYVEAMWLMLQQEKPDDYVIATGEAHTVKDFISVAFNSLGLDNGLDFITVDPKLYRPAEVVYLCGRATKAEKVLGWKPKISFETLVKRMVRSDIDAQQKSS